MSVTSLATDVRGGCDDREYSDFLSRINARFLDNTKNGTLPVFTTDADGLFDAYLSNIPESERQHHLCNACRHFVNDYGGLVTISPDGHHTIPTLWNEDDASDFYRAAIAAVAKIVRRARVSGVFIPHLKEYGKPKTGVWQHLSVAIPAKMLYRGVVQTASQFAAEKLEDYRNIRRALSEFTADQLDQALTLLQTEALYRSEKVLGPVQWLRTLHKNMAETSGQCRDNVAWLAIATAPAGFCHPRSSMAGTLLEDIAAGYDLESASKRFASKMHPLQYQRPQADPSAGTIAQAEKIVEQLGAAGALARRFARLDEIEAIWRAAPVKSAEAAGGVFGHLKPKCAAVKPQSMIPNQVMTWEKFYKTVLPTADRIQYHVPHSSQSYAGLVTAANADAPPILQWDSLECRNPVSWYVWHGGSSPTQFGLRAGELCEVDAVTLKPSMWFGDRCKHQGKGLLLILDGARESRMHGNALFPETLKAEFHGIRSVIESYSRSAEIAGLKEPHACGLMLNSGGPAWNAKIRVTSGPQIVDYTLDRWD